MVGTALSLVLVIIMLPYATKWIGKLLPDGSRNAITVSAVLSRQMEASSRLETAKIEDEGVISSSVDALFIGQVQNVVIQYRYEASMGIDLKKVKMTPIRMAGMLFCLTAAGAFGIEDMIPLSGPGFTLVMLVVFAVIWAYPISQIVSELSAIMPSEGGIYIWVKEALGEFWGFCTSWWGIMNCYLGLSVYIVLITDYASKFVPALQDPVTRFIVLWISGPKRPTPVGSINTISTRVSRELYHCVSAFSMFSIASKDIFANKRSPLSVEDRMKKRQRYTTGVPF